MCCDLASVVVSKHNPDVRPKLWPYTFSTVLWYQYPHCYYILYCTIDSTQFACGFYGTVILYKVIMSYRFITTHFSCTRYSVDCRYSRDYICVIFCHSIATAVKWKQLVAHLLYKFLFLFLFGNIFVVFPKQCCSKAQVACISIATKGIMAYRKPPLQRLTVSSTGCKTRPLLNFGSSSVIIPLVAIFHLTILIVELVYLWTIAIVVWDFSKALLCCFLCLVLWLYTGHLQEGSCLKE